jgi:aminomethyltransferase
MAERGIPRHGYQVSHNGQVVGYVTSGSQSVMLNVGIGMAYVPTELAAEGTEIDIIIREKPVKAKVVKAPFVKNTSLSKK